MRRNEINYQLTKAAFEYFYWFSRFEFALKENGYLKNHAEGANAEASWREFQEKFCSEYVISTEARRLLDLHPKHQIVSTNNDNLRWIPVGISHCKDDLCKVITMLKAIRNNLFHGGKHGDTDVDNRQRNQELLKIGKLILDQLASMANLQSDYTRYY